MDLSVRTLRADTSAPVLGGFRLGNERLQSLRGRRVKPISTFVELQLTADLLNIATDSNLFRILTLANGFVAICLCVSQTSDDDSNAEPAVKRWTKSKRQEADG